MRTLKKLKTTISANIETFINEIENQEAVINSLINDIKLSRNKINIQINEVTKFIQNLNQEKAVNEKQIKIWKLRAKEVHEENPEIARNCVVKLLNLQQKIEEISLKKNKLTSELEHLNNEKKIIENKLFEIENKKRNLITKQESQNCLNSINKGINNEEIDNIFNRWEDKILIDENNNHYNHATTFSEVKDETELYFEQSQIENKINIELQEIIKEV